MTETQPACGDLEPHMFHTHVNMHFKEVWCRGVCDCGGDAYYGKLHSPGEHK